MSIDTPAKIGPAADSRPLARKRKAVWKLITERVVLSSSAGAFHAIGWLFPGTWLPVWIGQALFIALAVNCRPRSALAYGSLGGAFGIGLSFYWGIAALQTTCEASLLTASLVFAVLVAVEATGFGLFCFTLSFFAQRSVKWMWLAPCAWVAIERWFPRIFPWTIGYSQLEFLPLVQIAEMVGSTGIGFVVTAVAAIPSVLALGLPRGSAPSDRRCSIAYTGTALLLLAATLAFGQARILQWEAQDQNLPKLKLALIQVDPAFVGAEVKLRELSLAVHEQVDLLCWPELALGTYSERLTHFRDPEKTALMSRDSHDLLEPTKDLACHVLAGGKLYGDGASSEGPYAMAAFVISPELEILGRYRKRTLIPFGEYIPGQAWFPALRQWASIDELMEAGNDPSPLTMKNGCRLGLVLCYEDTLPVNARQTVANGAEVLFSLIQGTAFEDPLTLVQHQRLAVLRAVENRRYLVRCSSTGVTCVVDQLGRIRGQLPMHSEGTMVCEVGRIRVKTLYNRMGDIFPILCAAGTLSALFWARR